MDVSGILALSPIFITVISGIVIIIYFSKKASPVSPVDQDDPPVPLDKGDADKATSNVSKSKKKADKVPPHRDNKSKFSHPWLLSSLKGHNDNVLDMSFSPNGKYLASCSMDRSVLLWQTRHFSEREHKSTRVNVEFDHATGVSWSPDNHALLCAKHNENRLQVYKLSKKSDGTLGNPQVAVTFDKLDDDPLVGSGISSNGGSAEQRHSAGHYVMCCSERGRLTVFDLRGGVLASTDTRQAPVHAARISPCGRFIMSAGFTPDVKVWEVAFTRSGDFDKLSRAFELKGHTSGVLDLSATPDSFRMVTVSRDGTWKLFNTNVEYRIGQDPQLIQSAPCGGGESGPASRVALSPDGCTVAVGARSDVQLFSAETGDMMATLAALHSSPITCMLFDPTSRYLLTTGDKHIRILHNVPGCKVNIQVMQDKLAKTTNHTLKERLTAQVKELRAFLSTLGE
ncbi:Transducin beta-like protein 2 [Amphibalanus amphitrite]|uniref:Transducin beta-like protein 2 n=1 Tax=Amphibalanus amphitrite TaxID=1232801 RepID=A0A6A4XBV0_AMPAM|nr:Transducin beta-like protein 2 [Amphibalanus amphitrite]